LSWVRGLAPCVAYETRAVGKISTIERGFDQRARVFQPLRVQKLRAISSVLSLLLSTPSKRLNTLEACKQALADSIVTS